jgi:hypothetical protein
MMKVWPLVLGLVGGCITQPGGSTGYGGSSPDPGTSGSGSGVYGCHADSECGGLVCARTGECLRPSEVRVVHVAWTVNAQVASAATCVNAPDLELTFGANTEGQFGFAPVPCVEGKFTIDKMPRGYSSVQLEREYDYNGGTSGTFDSTGSALLDLPY